jgi:hypothetical protein
MRRRIHAFHMRRGIYACHVRRRIQCMSHEEEDTCMRQDLLKPLLQGFALLRRQTIHPAAELFENGVVVLGLHESWPHENQQEEAQRLISVRSPACARGREHEKDRESTRKTERARER